MENKQSDVALPSVHLAVSSYIPGSPSWEPRWPPTGPAEYGSVFGALPEPELVKVFALPFQCPGNLHFQRTAMWVVLEIAASDFAANDGIVNFTRGSVVFNGPLPEARAYIASRGFDPPASIAEVVNAADWGQARAGDYAVALGGEGVDINAGRSSLAFCHGGRAVAGEHGFAISPYADVEVGDHGFAVTAHGLRAKAGDWGLASVDEFAEAVAGDCGVAIAKTGGEARAGRLGIALGRFGGSATAGHLGVALVALERSGYGGRATVTGAGVAIGLGDGCIAQAGVGGVLVLMNTDPKSGCERARVAHVGEGGILPDTPYTLDDEGRFVPANQK